MKIYLFIAIIFIASCNTKGKEKIPSETNKKNDTLTIAPSIDSTQKKKIFLTFDDGPTVGSKRLYELIMQEQLPVTLYLVGMHYDAMPMMHKELENMRKLPYVVFANHSYTHAWHDKYTSFYNSTSGVLEDYEKAEKTLNITSTIARCAGRNVWRTSLVNITDDKGPGTAMDSLAKLGYQFTGWDCTWPYDYKNFKNTRDVAGMMNRIKLYFDSSFTKQPNAIVILGHDQQFADDEDFNQLKDFVKTIKASKEYEFANIYQYPGIKKGK